MRKLIAGVATAAFLATSSIVATAPAAAEHHGWRGGGGGWHGGGYRGGGYGYRGGGGYYRGGGGYYGHHRHGGVSTGAAVGIGLLGLGAGAAIASSNQSRYDGYDGYYAQPQYGYQQRGNVVYDYGDQSYPY